MRRRIVVAHLIAAFVLASSLIAPLARAQWAPTDVGASSAVPNPETPAAAQPSNVPASGPATPVAPPQTSTPAPAVAQQPAPAPVILVSPPGTVDASGEQEPSTGLGLMIPGVILMGIGAINLAFIPICSNSDLYSTKDKQDACTTLSLAVGGGALAVGLPLFIVGLNKHGKHNDWEAKHPHAKAFVPRLQLGAPRAGVGLTLSSEF